MLSVFCSPGRYSQGRGATAALGREMSALGLDGPVLLIAGKTVIGQLAGTWKSSFDEAGLHHEVHRFAGECSPAEVERVKGVARQCGAHTIVGAGGGKVLDMSVAASEGATFAVSGPPVREGSARCLSTQPPSAKSEGRLCRQACQWEGVARFRRESGSLSVRDRHGGHDTRAEFR
jgi:glycerol dehydrogenase